MPEKPQPLGSNTGVKRFNLTFSGEILPGTDAATARRHFGQLFQIHDPTRVERFFSGTTVTLRRNLEQKAAAAWFVRMRGLGLQAHLEAVPLTRPATAAAPAQGRSKRTPASPSHARWGPNPYTLKPYRAPAAAAERARQAARRAHIALATALLALCLLFALDALEQLLPPPPEPPVLQAAAASESGELMLATSRLLLHHDRSGAQRAVISTTELGLTAPIEKLLWLNSERLLVQVASTEGGNLYRCTIADKQCRAFAGDQGHWRAEAMVRVPNSAHLVLADSAEGRLLRVDGAGNTIAEGKAALAAHPTLRIHDGLLFISSAGGPALSVFRYEPTAFAQQLDELLLLPEAALAAELDRVQDFARAGPFWWAVLESTGSGQCGVFRFDSQWNTLPPVLLPTAAASITLVPWGDRMLLLRAGENALLRFAADGTAGKALESEALTERATQRSQALQLRATMLQSGRGLLLVLSVLAACFGLWQYGRQRVFAAERGRHAPMLGPRINDVEWLKPVDSVQRGTLRRALPRGHIGLLGPLLVLVDHRGVYHAGNGIQIQQHPRYLRIEGVQVGIGSRRRPAFDTTRWAAVESLLSGSSRSDMTAVLITMLESRQPLALAFSAALMLFLAASTLIVLA